MKRVRVHWNLKRAGYVVRGLPMRPGDMVYTDAVCVRNARFHATPAGAAYCRGFVDKRSGKVGARFVVAWVEGDACDCLTVGGADRLATYNPFRADTFTTVDTGDGVEAADHVTFTTVGTGKARKPLMACRVLR